MTADHLETRLRGDRLANDMLFPFRKLIVSLVLIVTLIGGSMMMARWLYTTRPSAERSGIAILPPLVQVHRVAATDVPLVFEGFGSARADRQATLTAEVSGVVIEVADGLRDGSPVEDDQLLVRIDDRDYQQQLARAESLAADVQSRIHQLDVEKVNIEKLLAIAEQEVSVNRDELNRLLDLFEKSQASQREADFARLAFQRSRRETQDFRNQIDLIEPRRVGLEATRGAHEADAQRARLMIEKCRIQAPFDGQVELLSVDVGDRVMPGGEIVRLVSTRLVEVPLMLPAAVRSQVDVGAQCRLEVENLPEVAWDGRIDRLSPGTDPNSRTFTAYVMVDNAAQSTPLLPGYFVTAQVAGPVLAQVLAVPRNAVIDDRLFIANGDRVHARTVNVQRYVGDRVVVTGQVQPGDLVIVTNLDKLSEGQTVRVAAAELADAPITPPGPSSNFVSSRDEP